MFYVAAQWIIHIEMNLFLFVIHSENTVSRMNNTKENPVDKSTGFRLVGEAGLEPARPQ